MRGSTDYRPACIKDFKELLRSGCVGKRREPRTNHSITLSGLKDSARSEVYEVGY